MKSIVTACLLIAAVMAFLTSWIFSLDGVVVEGFKNRRFAQPIEFYSLPTLLKQDQYFELEQLTKYLDSHRYLRRSISPPLRGGTYVIGDPIDCHQWVRGANGPSRLQDPSDPAWDFKQCVYFQTPPNDKEYGSNHPNYSVVVNFISNHQIASIFLKPPEGQWQSVQRFELNPELFAQIYGDQFILRRVIEISDIPPICLNSVLAIEDARFLDHRGISFWAVGRALIRNLRRGRISEGGSTITQQLVKNFFLTPERSLQRKIKEALLALLVEARIDKNDILQTYLNVIYMGQKGSFQIRGYGAAARHYFSKEIEQLNLPECALLAAIINNPGHYNPVIHPDQATDRRKVVLSRLRTLNKISDQEENWANEFSLPKKVDGDEQDPAPYFVDAVRRQLLLLDLNTDHEMGLRVYTTMDPKAQKAAQVTLEGGLKSLNILHQSQHPDQNVEGSLMSCQPLTGFITALVGGRSFRQSQYNRAIDAHRQVGSLMKPIVYLTALEVGSTDGEPFSPLSMISDEPFEHVYDGQKWSPKNYENKNYHFIPAYFGLIKSLNIATAHLGIQAGLTNVADTAHRLGILSPLLSLPAISLGAFELYPKEVLQVYSTFANMGQRVPLTLITRIEDFHGHTIYDGSGPRQQVIAPEKAAVLVGMLKQVIVNGTGKGIRAQGFHRPSAGKTGTTSQYRDAWFAGFTPDHAAVVWVGIDENESHGWSGSKAAAPIWAQYMLSYTASMPVADFSWPSTTEARKVSVAQQMDMGVPKDEVIEDLELIFEK